MEAKMRTNPIINNNNSPEKPIRESKAYAVRIWLAENPAWGRTEVETMWYDHKGQNVRYNPITGEPLTQWRVVDTYILIYEQDYMAEFAQCLDCGQYLSRYNSPASTGQEVVQFAHLHKKHGILTDNGWMCSDPPMPEIALL